MLHLNNYNNFLLKENINWFDKELLTLNESKTLDKLTKIWNNIFNKAKKLNKTNKTKFYSYALATLFSLYSYSELKNIIGSGDKDALSILDNLKYTEDIKDNTEDIETYFNLNNELTEFVDNIIEDSDDDKVDIEDNTQSDDLYRDPSEMKVSPKGRKNIKEEEGDPRSKGEPVLTAYNMGDGMITIGWGHAERKNKSKFRVGQKITRVEAQALFQQDIQTSANAVRRIFRDWKEKGIYVKLTQDQFDALVSITFNVGTGNLRRSNFIQSIKKNKLKKAGEQMLTFKIKNYNGLRLRRKREAAPFLN